MGTRQTLPTSPASYICQDRVAHSLPLFLPRQYDERMSFSETIFLFILALVVFGPKKLPEIARQIGKALNEFRRASNEFKAQIEQEISHLEVEERKKATLSPSPAPEGTASRTLNAGAASPETTPLEASPAATLAASAEQPALPHVTEPATEALPPSDSVSSSACSDLPPSEPQASELGEPAAVTSSTAQESHA